MSHKEVPRLEPLFNHNTSIGDANYLSIQEANQRITDGQDPEDSGLMTSIHAQNFEEMYRFTQMFPEDRLADEVLHEQTDKLSKDYVNAGLSVPETTDSFYEDIVARKARLDVASQETRKHIDGYIGEFTEIAHNARLEMGLPLSAGQVNERLSGIAVTLFDDLYSVRSGASASYFYNRKRMSVKVDGRDEERIRKAVFHELWHALSGRRIIQIENTDLLPSTVDYLNGLDSKKSGLSFNSLDIKFGVINGVGMNEGITDLLALAWANGISVNFSAQGKESVLQWQKLRALEADDKASYSGEISSIVDFLMHVDAKLVFNAYLKSDFDNLEKDRLAGTHALRDLYRQIKVLGGAARLQSLRIIEKLSSELRSGGQDQDEDQHNLQIYEIYNVLNDIKNQDSARSAPLRQALNKRFLKKQRRQRAIGINLAKKVSGNKGSV